MKKSLVSFTKLFSLKPMTWNSIPCLLSKNNPQCAELAFIREKMSSQIPQNMSTLKTIYNYVKYPEKNKYATIIIELSKLLRAIEQKSANGATQKTHNNLDSQLIDLAVCTENVSLAVYLHSSLSNFKNIINDQNYFVGKILERTLSNKRLVLSGDFFHVKASSLSSRIGYIEIPQYFSKIEESVSKGMILQETMNKKMLKNEHIDESEIKNMIDLRDTSLIAYSLKCVGVILKLNKSDQEELYEIGVTIGRLISLTQALLLKKRIPENIVSKLELINVASMNISPNASLEEYEEQVKQQRQKLRDLLKVQLAKFKIEEAKINEFVLII